MHDIQCCLLPQCEALCPTAQAFWSQHYQSYSWIACTTKSVVQIHKLYPTECQAEQMSKTPFQLAAIYKVYLNLQQNLLSVIDSSCSHQEHLKCGSITAAILGFLPYRPWNVFWMTAKKHCTSCRSCCCWITSSSVDPAAPLIHVCKEIQSLIRWPDHLVYSLQ